jgi:hypothetical protein
VLKSVLLEDRLVETGESVQIDAIPDTTPLLETLKVTRFERPSEDAIFPMEYAVYLLGSVYGKTVIEVGMADGPTASILPSLGARVIFGDVAEGKVVLRAGDSEADHVFCGPILHRVDPIVAGRQIRRVLKPGGSAIFNERIDNWTVAWLMSVIRSGCDPDAIERRFFTRKHALSVSRAVGVPGRQREFWLTTGLLTRMGLAQNTPAARMLQRGDAALLRRWRCVRRFAFQLVWEARKEC